jgi:hypothetical protein
MALLSSAPSEIYSFSFNGLLEMRRYVKETICALEARLVSKMMFSDEADELLDVVNILADYPDNEDMLKRKIVLENQTFKQTMEFTWLVMEKGRLKAIDDTLMERFGVSLV